MFIIAQLTESHVATPASPWRLCDVDVRKLGDSIPGTRRDMSTSKLQQQVSERLAAQFRGFKIQENIRPSWLTGPKGERLELDFYIEDLDLAIEVQGQQHYVYVPFFHGTPEEFNRRLDLDRAKRETCKEMGIALYEIDSEEAIEIMIGQALQDTNLRRDKTTEEVEKHIHLRTIERIRKITSLLHGFLTSDMPDRQARYIASRHHRRLREYVKHYAPRLFDILPPELVAEIGYISKRYDPFLVRCKELRVKRHLEREAARLEKARLRAEYAGYPSHKHPNYINCDPAAAARACRPNRERRAMRILKIQRLGLFTFKVWGGQKEHLIELTADGPRCDCASAQEWLGSECSHLAKYRLVYIEGVDVAA